MYILSASARLKPLAGLLAAMLLFGKHHGKSYEETANQDRGYCAWVLRQLRDGHLLLPNLREFAAYLQEEHGGVLQVGIHKGAFFDEVLREQPEYSSWAAELSDPGDGMKDFAAYVIRCRAEAPPSPANKKQRKDDEPRDFLSGAPCCICLNRAINAAFLPCGHAVSCLQCAQAVQMQGCPICRRDVARVLRIYGV